MSAGFRSCLGSYTFHIKVVMGDLGGLYQLNDSVIQGLFDFERNTMNTSQKITCTWLGNGRGVSDSFYGS